MVYEEYAANYEKAEVSEGTSIQNSTLQVCGMTSHAFSNVL
jgi:hypothetical protein